MMEMTKGIWEWSSQQRGNRTRNILRRMNSAKMKKWKSAEERKLSIKQGSTSASLPFTKQTQTESDRSANLLT